MRSGRRHLPVLLLLLGLVATGCGGGTDVADPGSPDEPPAAEPDADDPDEPDADAPDGTDGPDEDEDGPEVSVYFVRATDAGTWVEPETHELEEPTDAVARAAMELLFAGRPHDAGLDSAAPDDVRVLATNVRDRVLIVDVSARIEAHGTGSATEVAFAQQLAHTGAAFPTVDAVELWVEGEPIDELWGHLDWSQPIEPDPFAVSPITLADPPAGPGEITVPAGEVVLRGEARVFEATFGIRVLGPDGGLVHEDVVMADAGAPERGAWEHTVTLTEPGTYTVELEEPDPSDGEGRPPFVLTRTLEVR